MVKVMNARGAALPRDFGVSLMLKGQMIPTRRWQYIEISVLLVLKRPLNVQTDVSTTWLSLTTSSSLIILFSSFKIYITKLVILVKPVGAFGGKGDRPLDSGDILCRFNKVIFFVRN